MLTLAQVTIYTVLFVLL